MLPYSWIQAAAERIAPHIEHTPVIYDGTNDIFLKLDSLQVTGSFKLRGALNKILSLQPWERRQGLVTASAGNHGLGVAQAGALSACSVTVFVPEGASRLKVEKIQQLGAQIISVPGGYASAERVARQHAASTGMTWVSAYNDGQVVAGQGTIALELLADLPDLQEAAWVVPVGGGGLISGIAAVLAESRKHVHLYGVQPAASPFFKALFERRPQEAVVETNTLADGLAGAIEADSLTIPIVRRYVEQIVLVSEAELVAAMAYAWTNYCEPIEPSGAAGLAAVLSGKIPHRPAVVIISGGNIAADAHLALIKQAEGSHA
jgi:threonine dehydratase